MRVRFERVFRLARTARAEGRVHWDLAFLHLHPERAILSMPKSRAAVEKNARSSTRARA